MTFSSVEQRMANTYLDTFPPFVPAADGPAARSQEQFYRFMQRLYELLRQQPQLLVSQLHPDDAHTNRFNKSQDQKPKLRDQMRKMLTEIDGLLATLYKLGQEGQFKGGTLLLDRSAKPLKKRHRAVLEELGLCISKRADGGYSLQHPDGAQLFPAWKWLATRPGTSLLAFSRCFFRSDYVYASDIYADLLGDEQAFRRLEAHLLARGYVAYPYHDGQVSLDYLNVRDDTAKPKCGFQYGVRYPGISLSYDGLVKSPPVLGLCIPCMKDLLTGFAAVPPKVQAFLLERTRRCSNCRYCVQTDKTGKRPLARIPIKHAGQTLQLCPYFPGYSYCWTELNRDLADNLIATLDYMDQLPAAS